VRTPFASFFQLPVLSQVWLKILAFFFKFASMLRKAVFIALAVLFGVVAIFIAQNNSHASESTKPTQWPGRNNTVLFMSNAEHGLANVLLATSHALITEHQYIETHFATFPSLAADIATISKSSPKPNPITFHPFKGQTYGDALGAQGHAVHESINAPGLSGLALLCNNIQKFLMPWSAEEYLSLYHESLKVMDEVNPVIVAIDPLFGPGMDAVRATGRNHVIVSPNSLKDNFADKQPFLSMLWKYPA
jgi:hypothetical protein